MGERHSREEVGEAVDRAVEQARGQERAELADHLEHERFVDERVVESLFGEHRPRTR